MIIITACAPLALLATIALLFIADFANIKTGGLMDGGMFFVIMIFTLIYPVVNFLMVKSVPYFQRKHA